MTSNTLDTPKVSAGFDINAQFRAVMHELGLSPEDTGGSITFIGEDPIFPTKHRLGACIGIPIMAGAAGVADIWRQRSGRGQDLTLDPSKENSHNVCTRRSELITCRPRHIGPWRRTGAPADGSRHRVDVKRVARQEA